MNTPLNLIPDAPITGPGFDRLDRMSFVRSFAEAIRSADGPNSVVLALAGPWGSGKSSLLNLISGELLADKQVTPPLIIKFNPWWFTGTGQLVPAFLQQLGAAVSRPEVVDRLGEATEALDRLADALANPGELHRRSLAERDIQVLRERVDSVLRKSDRRILIFLDDIDRLTPDEMSQLLLIVRAVADFPQTTYVLSLDYEVVVEAMREKLGVDGRTYLEKVVQLQIDVPLPTRMTLERMVIGQLAAIDPDAEKLDEESRVEFRVMFENGIKHFLVTPRACTRFLNVVRFIYPTVKGQVYVPDLLGLSCLMAFSSQAIQAIRSFQDAFVGPCDERGRGWVDLSSFHERWLSKLTERDRGPVEAILRMMFPKVAWALNGPLLGEMYLSGWTEKLKICSAKNFDTYFRLGLSAGEATEYQWQNLVELLDDATSFAKALNQFGPLGDEKAETWMMDLLQQASEFVADKASTQQVEKLFLALLKRGDQVDVLDEETEHERLIEPIHRVVALLIECLQKMDTPHRRTELLLESFEKEASIYTATELFELLERRTDLLANKDQQGAVSDTLKKILRSLVRRIEVFASSGELERHPKRLRILKKWHRYGRKAKAREWLSELSGTDQEFSDRLTEICQDKSLMSDADRKQDRSFPLDQLVIFYKANELADRIDIILDEEPDWLDLGQEVLLNTILTDLKNLAKSRQ